MEFSTQNAFQVIFPKYLELLSQTPMMNDEGLQTFIRDELPQKIQLVRSIEPTFLAFQTQFTNLILKRPKQQNLIQSLTLKASQKIQKYFSSLQLSTDKQINKGSLSNELSFMNLQSIRSQFRQKLKQSRDLLKQKYFDNYHLEKTVQEQIARRLYSLNQIYYFLKNDLTSVAGKYRVKEHQVLNEINKNGSIGSGNSEICDLLYVDDKFLDNVYEIIDKRYRPFTGKRDFFFSKIKQIETDAESKVPMNISLLVQSILGKEKYRVNKEITANLTKELRAIDDYLQQQTQRQCKQIIAEVDSLKREFNQVKNNVFYLDIIRGTFVEKYKMELNKLQNVYYLSNIQKYLQDVQTFTEKLIRVEQKIIDNRKTFMKRLAKQIQDKIAGLITQYEIKNSSSPKNLRQIIDTEFDALKDSLYGLIKNDKLENKQMNNRGASEADLRRKKADEFEQRRLQLQRAKQEKQRQRRIQLQQKAQRERIKREQDKIKLQQRRKAEDERIKRMRQQRQQNERMRKMQQVQKDRIRQMQMQEKRKQMKIKQEQDKQRLKEQMKRKQEQKKRKDQEDAKLRERQRQQKQMQNKRRAQQMQSKKREIEETKRRRQEQQKLEQQRLRDQKQRTQQMRKQQQQRQRRERQLKLQKQKQERERKQRQIREKRQRLQNERRQQQQKEKRQRQQRQREQQQRRQKQKDEKLQREREQQLQRQRKERENQQKQRERQKLAQLQKQRKQKQEKQRRQRQEKERRQLELQRQREIKQREERQLHQRKQRQQRERKQRQQKQRRERQQRQRKQKEQRQIQEKQRRQKQEKQRRQRQQRQKLQKQKRQREELERKNKLQQEKRQRQQKQRKQKEERQRREKEQKDRKQKEQRARKQKQQKEKRQLEQLMLEEESKNKSKPKPKGGSGINYDDLDDMLDDDLDAIEQQKSQAKINNANKQDSDQEFGDDYEDDFESPQKEQQGQQGQEQMIQPKELITMQSIKCLNDYMKGTSYARKNKPNLEPYNNTDSYTYLFEQFMFSKKIYIFNVAVSNAVLDLGKQLLDQNAVQEDIKEYMESIKEHMFEQYASKIGEENFQPRTMLIFPFSFKNDSDIRVIQFLPAQAWFRIILGKQIENEQAQQKVHALLEGLLNIFEIQAEPSIQTIVIPQDSLNVLATFDKQLPCLILLYCLHYEVQLKQQPITVNQYTVERFFYTLQVLKPLYEAIENNQDELVTFFEKETEKYSGQGNAIQILPIQINSAQPQYEQQLQQYALQAKQMFMENTTVNTMLVAFQVLIMGEEQGEQQEANVQKITIYCSMQRTSPKPTITYFIVTKDDDDRKNAQVLFDACSQGDEPFEVLVYMDFTRHNGLSSYSDWTLPLWARSIQKRKLNPTNAFRALTFSMTPYYVAYKQQD